MKFTGERYMPTEAGEIRLEHVHRYAVALAWARGKRVLDVACGEGYGTRLLATVAESVEGVDISADAVERITPCLPAYPSQSKYARRKAFTTPTGERITFAGTRLRAALGPSVSPKVSTMKSDSDSACTSTR